MKTTIETIGDTSAIGIHHVRQYALLLFLAGIPATLFLAGSAMVLFGVPFLDALMVAGFLMSGVLVYFLLTSADKVSEWMGKEISDLLAWSAHEREKQAAKLLPPTTETTYLPTSTPEPREIPVRTPDRVGVVTLDYVNGFDPRDLEWFAKYLANGGRTSENVLEKYTLFHEGVTLGGLKDGTPLTRLLDLCEKRGILTARDKARHKSGSLLIPNEQEILRLLLLEDTTP
jgi:hypothetical protein